MKITKTKLKELKKNYNKNTIEQEVLNEALKYDDPKTFFTDLMTYGCQSGMVSKLIYYTDTHKFFDKYYDQIDELREEIEDSFGEPLKIEGDLKNWLAWFAFEETARKIYENDL